MRWAGTPLGSWANLPIQGCGSSATHGGGLATPLTFASIG